MGENIDKLNRDLRQMEGKTLLEKQDELLFSNTSDIDMADIAILRKALFRLQLRRQRISSDR